MSQAGYRSCQTWK